MNSLQQKFKGNWELISVYFEDRNASQCLQRFYRLNPTKAKLRWTSSEDQVLLSEVEKQGFNWKKINKALPHKTSK